MIDPLGIKKNDPLGIKKNESLDLKKKVASKPLSQEELWGSNSQPQDLYTSLATETQEDQQVSDGLDGPPNNKPSVLFPETPMGRPASSVMYEAKKPVLVESTPLRTKPTKYLRIVADDKKEVEKQISDLEERNARLGRRPEDLTTEGTYQALQKKKAQIDEEFEPVQTAIKQIQRQAATINKPFERLVYGATNGKYSYFTTDIINLNKDVEDKIADTFISAPKETQVKWYKGGLTVESKEEIINSAKTEVLNDKYNVLKKDADNYIKNIKDNPSVPLEEKLKFQKDFKERSDGFNAQLALDYSGKLLKNNFKVTDLNKNIDEGIISKYEGFIPDALDLVSTFAEGMGQIVANVMTGIPSSALIVAERFNQITGISKPEDYTAIEATEDWINDTTNINFLPSSQTKRGKINYDELITGEGDSNLSIYSVGKTLAKTLPFTLKIMNDVKKGRLDGTPQSMIAQLINPKYSKDFADKLRVVETAYKGTISNNYRDAKDMGMDDSKAFLYANTLSLAEGVSENIMPDYKYFDSLTGSTLKSLFKGNLKQAVTKQAAKNVTKDFFKNFALETGEEEVVLAVEDALKYSLLLNHKNSEFANFSRQKELVLTTAILSGALGSVSVNQKFKQNKTDLYNTIHKNIYDLQDAFLDEIDSPLNDQKAKEALITAYKFANDVSAAVSNAPENVTSDQIDLLVQKKNLEEKKKTIDTAFHPDINEEITGIDAKIRELAKMPVVEESIDAEKNKEYLGTPTISTIEDGDLYEFKTEDGIIGGVMISPTEFRIDGISANEVGKGQGSKMFEALIENLKTKGVTTLTTKSAGEGAVKMHNKAVDKGLLTKVKEDGRTATFSINSEIEIPAAPAVTPAVEEEAPAVEEATPTEVLPVTEEVKVESNGIEYTKNENGNWVNTKTGNEVKGIGETGKGLIKILDELSNPKTEAEQYTEELDKTKESDPETYWSVSPVSAEDAAKGTVIDTPDGAAIVKPNGDIAGLFKKATSKAKGVAQDLLKRAVEAGGKKLDNFDGYLTKQYEKAGFRIVSRTPFNEEYAPDGWNREKHGTPDVVVMVYDPEGKLDIEEKTFDEYDDAIAYRDSFLESPIDAELEGLAKLFDESDKGFRMSQVENAKQALKKILPSVKFIVHETNEAYNKAVGDGSSGSYIMSSNGDKVIHINKQNANGRTVAHEVFHAVILDKIKGDKAVQDITARMVDAVYKTANPELKAKLDAFAARYSDEAIRDEERLAELIGIIADGYPQLSPVNKGIVKRWLDALAKTFGLKPFTDNEVIDLLNTLAGKVSTGEVISTKDVAILSEKEINIPGSQIIGSINIKPRRQAKVADFDTTPPKVEGVNMIYPSKSDIKDVLEKSGGAAIFINSDGTKVGKVSINGRDIIVQGGIDYTFIKENVDDSIGFAASEDSKISYLKSISEELIKERDAKNPQHKGKPIAVFVVAQNGETMLGEWYAAEYIMEGIDQSISKNETVLEDIKKDFIDAIESAKLSGNKSGLADRKAKDKVLKMIKEGKFDTHKGRIEIAKEMASKDFSFGFRVNLNKELIAGNEKSWNSGKNRSIKKALSDVGHTMNDFWNKFLDERFLKKLNNTKLQANKGSSISNKTFSGFFYNPSDSLEDQVNHAKLGIDHAQFNSSFKSQENFLLDSAYDVNKLFPNMGYPTQEGLDIYNKANKTKFVKEVKKKNPLGLVEATIIDKGKISKWLNENGYSKLVVNPYSSVSLSIYTGNATENPNIEEEDKTIKKLQQATTIDDMVRIARQSNYSDAAITAFLKTKGFSDAQITNALAVNANRPSVNKIYEDSKKAIDDKKKRTSIKDLAPFIRKSLLDRQAYIKRVINKIDNKSAKKAYDLLVTKAGASALASERFKRAEKKIYGGLNSDDTSTLDKIIYAKRMVAVNESRAKLGLEPYKGMDGYSIDDANQDLADFKNSLGDKKFNDLSNRATEYFDVFKLNLKKLYESGRISKEVYDSLKDTEYSPIKTIKYIIGDNLSVDEIDTQAKSLGIARKDIMKLSDSNENEIILDSKWLLAMSINSVEGRAFENNMLREFDKAIKSATPEEKKVFEDIVLDNPVVGTKKDGSLKYKYDDTRLPVGYTKVSYFNDGNKVDMVLKDQYAKQLLDVKNKNKALETIGSLTGTKILRFFATGGNPLFIIGNTAVDFQNIAFFSNVYSKFKPMATAQLARDYTKNFVKKLVVSNEYNTIFNEYINHGGALDYMASDGLRSLESMNPVKGVTKAVQKGLVAYGRAMSLLGETSEVAFRLSVFQKVKEDAIKEFKKDNNREPNAQELDDILWNAGRQSRETMDFSQGGDVAKNIDAVFPYFNAALQGIRRPIDFAKNDPVGFSSSVLQYTAMASSLAAGSFAMLISAVGGDDDDDEKKAKKIINVLNSVSEYEKANYHIMFTGNVNKDGEYEYYRAKKLPVLSVISTVAEQLIYKAFFESKGVDYDMDSDAMLEAVNKSNPLPVTVQEVAAKNPVASGLVSYWANKDTFTGDKIFREPDNKKILPEAEGMFDDRVDQIYKDLAPGFGLSPARTKVMVEKVITSANTNPTIPLIYSAYDGLFNKNDGPAAEAKEAMKNVGDAFGKKLVRYTDKNIIRYKNQDEKEYQESVLETKVWNSEQKVYNEIKKKYDGGGSVTKKELIELVKENFEPMDYMKYAKKYNAYIHNMNIDKSVLDIIFEDVPEVQAMKLNQRYGPNLEEEELKELGRAMNSAGKRINNKSIYIYNKKYKNRKDAQ